jgi:hypothetical protein
MSLLSLLRMKYCRQPPAALLLSPSLLFASSADCRAKQVRFMAAY